MCKKKVKVKLWKKKNQEKSLEPSQCGKKQINISKTSLKNLEIDYLAVLWFRKLAPEQRVKLCCN